MPFGTNKLSILNKARELNLLLISENEKRHFVLITDFNKLMRHQTKQNERKHFCVHCLQCFSSERVLADHKEVCIQVNKTQGIKMPTKDNNILKYNNHQRQLRAPFVIYADFEVLTGKINGCQLANNKSFTESRLRLWIQSFLLLWWQLQQAGSGIQRPTSCIQVSRSYVKLSEVKYCRKIIKTRSNKPLKMPEVDDERFQQAEKCHICDKTFKESNIGVRDHCYVAGIYIGSALQDCNFNFHLSWLIKYKLSFTIFEVMIHILSCKTLVSLSRTIHS